MSIFNQNQYFFTLNCKISFYKVSLTKITKFVQVQTDLLSNSRTKTVENE